MVFTLRSNVPVAGLQGRFDIIPPTLAVTSIVPIGDASGFRLSWTRTDSGARFVMFSDAGAPLPPDSLGVPGRGILAVTVEVPTTVALPAGVAPPAETRIYARDLQGSDPNGGLVPECPIPIAQWPSVLRTCATWC